MPSLPKTLKIGHIICTVEEWHHRSAQSSDRFGEFSAIEQVIRVDTSHHLECVRETFLHEILHAIYHVFNLHQIGGEEAIVASMAGAITTVMIDNPQLVEYFNNVWKDSQEWKMKLNLHQM